MQFSRLCRIRDSREARLLLKRIGLEFARFARDAPTLSSFNSVFAPVRREVRGFSLSGFEVVKSWLAYRMRDRSGKKSSPLDDIRPERWIFDGELLNLLWVLDHTFD